MVVDLSNDFFPPELADEAIYENANGQSTVNVIFDAPHSEQEIDGVIYMNTKPVAHARVEDIPDLVTGDGSCTLTVRGVTYYIIDDNPDGTGWYLLTLSEDAP